MSLFTIAVSDGDTALLLAVKPAVSSGVGGGSFFTGRARFCGGGRGGGATDDTCVETSVAAYVRVRPRRLEGMVMIGTELGYEDYGCRRGDGVENEGELERKVWINDWMS